MARRLLRITLGTLLAMGALAAPAAASDGPVGQWLLDDGAGAVAADTSGYGDNGAVISGAAWVNSPTGGALYFDGATGRVRVPDAPQLEPTDAVSVVAWTARQGSPGDYKYIVSKGATGCIAASYGLYSGPDGGLQFYVSSNQGTRYVRSLDAGTGIWDGKWHLVVGTFDGSTIRLYVDGREIGTGVAYPGTLSYGLPDSNDLYIGDYPGCDTAKNFLGNIAGVEIWNRALTPTEVYDMVQPPAQPVLPPPVTAASGPPIVLAVPFGSGQTVQPGFPSIGRLFLRSVTYTGGALRALSVTFVGGQQGEVTFSLGRLDTFSGARCRPKGHAGSGNRCLRWVTLARFNHAVSAGFNRVRLPKAWDRLRHGQYRLVAVPSSSGISGRSATVTFRVLGR